MSSEEYKSSPLRPANFKANRIQITAFRHLLPADVFGSNDKNYPAVASLKLSWRNHTVETDIPAYSAPKSGPREFFRSRSFAKLFLEDSGAEVGDRVVFEKVGSHEFRLHLEKPDGKRVE